MNKTYTIYRFTIQSTNLSYTGQTLNSVDDRLKRHLRTESYFGRALRKYGIDDVEIQILEENITTLIESNTSELFWIAWYGDYTDGYNLTKGGDGTKGWVPSKEWREKVSDRVKGDNNPSKRPEVQKKMSENHADVSGKNNPMYNKKHPKETREQIKAGRKLGLSKMTKEERQKSWGRDTAGNKNANAKKINIYDCNNKLKYRTHGNFQEICSINNLPFKFLKISYQTNTKISLSRKKNIQREKYLNWYAKIL